MQAELAADIRKVWQWSKALGIAETFATPTSLSASDDFKQIALDGSSSYEALYLTGLRLVQYNIMLVDYSYFQFSNSESGFRFAYYPNPFIGASEAAVSSLSELQEFVLEGLVDYEEFLRSASEIRIDQHPPLLRYEYAEDQYDAHRHPCSHIHLGYHSENRLPIRRRWTANAFSLFVFRLYYLQFWLTAPLLRVGKSDLSLDDIYSTAKQNSKIIPAHLFSDRELRQFHLD